MASNTIKVEGAYQKWKSLGLKRSLSQSLADEFGVSRQTLYKWSKKPISDSNGNKYDCWEDRLLAETKEVRENYEKEINNQLENGYKLVDVIMNDMLMKLACKVKDKDYVPSLEDVIKITELSEKIHSRVDNNGNSNDDDSNPSINFNIGFRSDSSD